MIKNIAIGVLLIVVVGFAIPVGCGLLGTATNVATLPSRIVNETVKTQNVISNYEWFHDVNAGVKGKITSSGKRLTSPYQIKTADCGQNYCDMELPSPSDEGTWGSSSPYIYFWTVSGQYIQWSGNYLYSDKPFRLNSTVVPVILSDTP